MKIQDFCFVLMLVWIFGCATTVVQPIEEQPQKEIPTIQTVSEPKQVPLVNESVSYCIEKFSDLFSGGQGNTIPFYGVRGTAHVNIKGAPDGLLDVYLLIDGATGDRILIILDVLQKQVTIFHKLDDTIPTEAFLQFDHMNSLDLLDRGLHIFERINCAPNLKAI